MEVNAMSKYY